MPESITVSTPLVIFSVFEDQMHALLTRRSDSHWQLPVGKVQRCLHLDTTAKATLAGNVVAKNAYLEQLFTFGLGGGSTGPGQIAVCYYALVPPDRRDIVAEGKAVWHSVPSLPNLARGHREIIETARARVAAKLDYTTLALQLVPPEFTLTELQQVYEIVRGEELDKRNFRKRVLSFGWLRDTGRVRRNGCHRPARLYQCADVTSQGVSVSR